jgi:LacI family transcriptional regulator, galactose operon repressor
MTPNKIRIKDIARLAGVSIGTVDRVIHERGEVAKKTRQKVKSILKETNYSPNVMAQVLKSKKQYHLISLLPESTNDNSFWQKHPVGMNKAMDDLDLFNVKLSQITFNILNEKDFQKKANDIFDLNPDGILLAPIFKEESLAFCSNLSANNIPFVFIDGFIEDAGFTAYIGEDIFQSGRVAGQLIDIITPKQSEILVINIARNIQNIQHLNKRTQGFFSYLEKSGKDRSKILKINIPDPTYKTIKNTLDSVFKENPGIRSIFISGSKSYLIARYIEERGLSSINLIGYDLLDLNVKYLKSGTTNFLIGQRPDEQSYKGIKKLFDFLSINKVPEKMEYLPIDIATSENVDFFL